MSPQFEMLMLICFGLSWPISAYKTYKSKSAGGKSIAFTLIILTGYMFGIIGKVLSGTMNYVLIVYALNVFFVLLDLYLCLKNRQRDRAADGAQQDVRPKVEVGLAS